MADASRQSLQIGALTPVDYPQLSDLHGQFFGVRRDAAFWRWKYEDRPEGSVHIAIAKAGDGSPVGQTGAVDYRFFLKGVPVLAAQAQDIVILDAYRSGKTFFNLERFARDQIIQSGAAFDYGFSIEITRKISTRTLGFTDIGSIDKMVHVLGIAPYLRQKLPFRWMAEVFGKIARPFLSQRIKSIKKCAAALAGHIETIPRFDPRFDALWEKQVKAHPVIASRTADWLNWRYVDNPVQRYQTFAFTHNEAVLGYMVVEVKTGFRDFSTLNVAVNDAKRGEIVDYLVDDCAAIAEVEILDALLHSAFAYFLDAEVDVISAWCLPHMSLFAALQRIGFNRRPTPHNLIVRRHQAVDDCVMDLKSWYITHGDKDHF